MSTKLLLPTFFEKSYDFFGVGDDKALIEKMCQIGLIYTVVVGIYTVFKAAPYGKHASEGAFSWMYGPLISARLSWVIQEAPAWIVPAILLYQSQCIHLRNAPNLILTVLFMAHYFQRSIIYPLRMTKRARPVPSLVCLSAFIFCCYNGLLQGHFLINVHMINGSSPFFFAGVALFIIGMAINIHHDGILLSLRQGSKGSEEKPSYKIPRGFLFEYVSGANYAGEILEWWGFAIASGGIPQFLFAMFSTIFLGGRAWHNHNFYLKTFGKSYPSSRKAVIPFIL